MAIDFPANSVIYSYNSTENMLKDILQTIPFCKEHENVWSPKLVTVILESCSQLDSLWKAQAQSSPCIRKKDFKIADYFEYFGETMSKRWVVFYGEPAQKICPFDTWSRVSEFKSKNYSKVNLDWWKTYNDLKHDRLKNQSKATLKDAVLSLAGLFIAIIKCDFCHDAIAQAGWMYGSGNPPHVLSTWLSEDSPSVHHEYIAVESSLFTYPVGWWKEKGYHAMWHGDASPRFIHWFNQNQPLT